MVDNTLKGAFLSDARSRGHPPIAMCIPRRILGEYGTGTREKKFQLLRRNDMALMEWDDSLSVNVTEIDNQHKKIVDHLNDLNDAMKERKGKEVMDNILESLLEYAATHFATEEKYFDQYNYTKTTAHMKEHTNFVIDIMEFKKDFDDGKITLSIDVMHFLKDWLAKHINVSDKHFV